MNGKQKVLIVFKLCFHQILIQFRQKRTYIIWGIMILYLNSLISPLGDFADAIETGIPIWVFVILVNDYVFPFLILSLAVLMYGNAPFLDAMSVYVIGRSGKCMWAFGMVLFLFFSSGIFVGMVLLGILLCILGNAECTMEWGECLRLQAYSDASEQFYVPFLVNASLISGYSPKQAMLLTVFLCWLVVFLLLLIVFIGNYLSSGFAGAAFAFAIVLLDLTIVNMLGFYWYKISPASLMKLTVLTGYMGHPSILYALKVLPMSVACLSALLVLVVMKKKGLAERNE